MLNKEFSDRLNDLLHREEVILQHVNSFVEDLIHELEKQVSRGIENTEEKMNQSNFVKPAQFENLFWVRRGEKFRIVYSSVKQELPGGLLLQDQDLETKLEQFPNIPRLVFNAMREMSHFLQDHKEILEILEQTVSERFYMNPVTGSVDTKDGWGSLFNESLVEVRRSKAPREIKEFGEWIPLHVT